MKLKPKAGACILCCFYVSITHTNSFNLSEAPTSENLAPAISLTAKALTHLNKIRLERNEDLCLRIGVKQGGCSGMSYTMDFEDRANAKADDSIIEYNGFQIGMFTLFLFFSYI